MRLPGLSFPSLTQIDKFLKCLECLTFSVSLSNERVTSNRFLVLAQRCFDVIILDLMRVHRFFAAILLKMDLCNVDAREVNVFV